MMKVMDDIRCVFYKVMLLSVLCTGCITNNYEEYYIDSLGEREMKSIHGDAPIILKKATTEDAVIDLMEDGYIPSGRCSFYGPYTPFSCAVDTAEKHGAALVLLDVRFRESRQYTSVMYLPSYSTTYLHGTANATAYGRGGAAHGYGSYSETATTTYMNAVPVQRNVDIYDHDAMFFKKVDTSGMYGVLWDVPPRLPTESLDAPIRIRVVAVFHGSEAEKQGIRRGAVVRTINGKPIRTRKDFAPFLSKTEEIKSMEVEYAR